MALPLKHQTPGEFAARFWARVRHAHANDKAEFERLVWRIWSWVQDGTFTNNEVRLSFNAAFGRSLTLAQWNTLVTNRLVRIKDRNLARINEAAL